MFAFTPKLVQLLNMVTIATLSLYSDVLFSVFLLFVVLAYILVYQPVVLWVYYCYAYFNAVGEGDPKQTLANLRASFFLKMRFYESPHTHATA